MQDFCHQQYCGFQRFPYQLQRSLRPCGLLSHRLQKLLSIASSCILRLPAYSQGFLMVAYRSIQHQTEDNGSYRSVCRHNIDLRTTGWMFQNQLVRKAFQFMTQLHRTHPHPRWPSETHPLPPGRPCTPKASKCTLQQSKRCSRPHLKMGQCSETASKWHTYCSNKFEKCGHRMAIGA